MLDANEVARYFLGTFDHEAGDNISNLKLQKLLYYAQGFHVAMHEGMVLFEEPLEAWDHGPVVPSIYRTYKRYSWMAIDRPERFDLDDYLPETRELLDAVNNVYGQFTAKRLEWMTHQEPPWSEASKNGVITVDSLRQYFTGLVEAGCRDESMPNHPEWPSTEFRFQHRRLVAARFTPHRDRLRAIAKPISDVPDPWADSEE